MKKPTSPQYEYAKGLSSDERTELARHLMRIIKGAATIPGVNEEQATQMWLSVQYARLRTHTRGQQAAFRSHQVGTVVGEVIGTTVGWFMMLPLVRAAVMAGEPGGATRAAAALTPFTAPIPPMLDNRREYFRDAARPEYRKAFNAFMSALADAGIPGPQKEVIFTELVERHIRTEKTIAPDQVNAIVHAMNGPELLPNHHTRRLPDNITPEMRAAVFSLAEGGYRIESPRRARRTQHAAAPARTTGVTREPALENYAKLPAVHPSSCGFEPGITKSIISLETLTYEDQPVSVRTAPGEDTYTGFYGYDELAQWLAQGGFDPIRGQLLPGGNNPLTREEILLADIPKWVVRIDEGAPRSGASESESGGAGADSSANGPRTANAS